jgi:DNA-binding NtrC family response regulator
VLMTGAGTSDTLDEALSRGAAGLVAKPFSHADQQAAVAGALDARGEPAPPPTAAITKGST